MHHLPEEPPCASLKPRALNALLPAAGTMAVLCLVLIGLLFII